MSISNPSAKDKGRTTFGGESSANLFGFGSYATPNSSAPTSLNPATSLFQSRPFGTSQPAFSLFVSSAPSATQTLASAPNAGPKGLFDRPAPASTTKDSSGNPESLSRFSAEKIFEKRKLTPDTTITFDSQALCQWLEKHHNFESTISTLLDLGTVCQKAAAVPDKSNPWTEPVNVVKPSTSKTEPAIQPAPSRNMTEPAAEPAPSTKTTNPPAEPAPSVMTTDSSRKEVDQTSTSTDSASKAKNPYQVEVTDPIERCKRFNNLPTGLVQFSPGVWDDALRVLVKESPFMVDVLKDARFEVEQQFALRFRDLMHTASNTPRFVKGVKQFTSQVSELLDKIFARLVTVAEEQKMQIDEEI